MMSSTVDGAVSDRRRVRSLTTPHGAVDDSSNEHVSYGLNLKRRRKDRGLTQEKLADLMHVDTKTIYRWEADIVKPGLKNTLRLDDILNKFDGIKYPFYEKLLDTDVPVAVLDGFAIFSRVNQAYCSLYGLEQAEIVGQYAPELCSVWREELPHSTGIDVAALSISDIESIELCRRDSRGNAGEALRHSVIVSRMERFSTLLVHRVERIGNADTVDPKPKIAKRIR